METPTVDKLNRRQEAAIVALLSHATVEEAAKSAKVGFSTLRRWMEEPAFEAAYRKARRLVFRQAVIKVQQLSTKAVEVLGEVMADKSTPAHARVSAAVGLLRFAREGIELEDQNERITAIETTLHAMRPSSRGEAIPSASL